MKKIITSAFFLIGCASFDFTNRSGPMTIVNPGDNISGQVQIIFGGKLALDSAYYSDFFSKIGWEPVNERDVKLKILKIFKKLKIKYRVLDSAYAPSSEKIHGPIIWPNSDQVVVVDEVIPDIKTGNILLKIKDLSFMFSEHQAWVFNHQMDPFGKPEVVRMDDETVPKVSINIDFYIWNYKKVHPISFGIFECKENIDDTNLDKALEKCFKRFWKYAK